MALDVDVNGKSVLIVLVILGTLFFLLFAPSIIAALALGVVLALIAYVIWIVGVRINRRATGRSRSRRGRR